MIFNSAIKGFLLALTSSFILNGCAMSPDEILHTNLNGYTYNSISRSYLDRPTEVSLYGDTLVIKVQGYGQNDVGVLSIKPEDVESTVAAIDKYLKWDALATKRGDIVKKNIAEVGGYTYAILGVNEGQHFFISHIPVLGDHLDSNLLGQLAILFPREEAIELRKILLQLKDNALPRTDLSVYN